MLNRELCKRCAEEYAAKVGDPGWRWNAQWGDECSWSRGEVCCPPLYNPLYRMRRIDRFPGDACPFIVEHVMSQGSC